MTDLVITLGPRETSAVIALLRQAAVHDRQMHGGGWIDPTDCIFLQPHEMDSLADRIELTKEMG